MVLVNLVRNQGETVQMAMDIENFVDAPGRAEKVKEVRKMIDELGIEYLYLQFVSVTGKIMGKGIPADHWESVAKKAFSWFTARP